MARPAQNAIPARRRVGTKSSPVVQNKSTKLSSRSSVRQIVPFAISAIYNLVGSTKSETVVSDKNGKTPEEQLPPAESSGSGDLADEPTEEIVVQQKPTEVKTKIGTKEFVEQLVNEFKNGKKEWRTPNGLAAKLGVDTAELAKWMDRNPSLIRVPGKEDGVFYYAIKPPDKKVPGPLNEGRKPITEEDRYAVACIHQLNDQFERVMKEYALRIHEKSEEAFAKLAKAKEDMGIGLILLANANHADLKKLP